MEDFREYYNKESYLFETVRHRFLKQGFLNAFDFFFIIIWKAERAKSKIAKKLLKTGVADLDQAAAVVTYGLSQKSTPKDKLHFIWNVGFDLPMASAILTVLYPDDFTIYDVRVCDQLGGFHNLKNKSNFDALWQGYLDFKDSVEKMAPPELSLRDKDRYLWGKSFCEQLNNDIKLGFK